MDSDIGTFFYWYPIKIEIDTHSKLHCSLYAIETSFFQFPSPDFSAKDYQKIGINKIMVAESPTNLLLKVAY